VLDNGFTIKSPQRKALFVAANLLTNVQTRQPANLPTRNRPLNAQMGANNRRSAYEPANLPTCNGTLMAQIDANDRKSTCQRSTVQTLKRANLLTC
jgi:hypothetical protein